MKRARRRASLRKPLLAAIEKAGLEPWDKLWTDIRATRDTELRGLPGMPSHVVDAFMGHSERVARSNYTQVLPEHFDLARKSPIGPRNAQHDAAGPSKQKENPQKDCKSGAGKETKWAMRDLDMSLETGKNGEFVDACTQYVPHENLDPVLLTLIELWPVLPKERKNDILECVQDFV